MPKKALKQKQQRTRSSKCALTHDAVAAGDPAPCIAGSVYAEYVCATWPTQANYPVSRRPVGEEVTLL